MTTENQAPEGALPYDSKAEQADAWMAVVRTLHEVAPGWLDPRGTGQELAVATIRRLAASSGVGATAPGFSSGVKDQSPAEGDGLAERLRNAYHSKTRIGHPLWQNLDADRKEPWLAVARAALASDVQPKGTTRLRGRAAIVKAWNDLPDAWRCHPALKQLHQAAQECEDADAAQAVSLLREALAGDDEDLINAHGRGWIARAQMVIAAQPAQAPAPAPEPVAEIVERVMGGSSRGSPDEHYLDVAPLRGATLPPKGTKLCAIPCAAVAPEGMVLMPLEPTAEMETAAENAYEGSGSPFPDWLVTYRAMVAAAGQPAVAPDMRDAYAGAREDLADWKRRALAAEKDTRRLDCLLNDFWFGGTTKERREAIKECLSEDEVIAFLDAEMAASPVFDVPVRAEPVAEPIRCPERLKNGGTCPHHNLHCGWPACNKETP